MLFPLTTRSAPRTSVELDTSHDGLPVVSWVGVASATTGADACVPNGPGMRLLGEHSY